MVKKSVRRTGLVLATVPVVVGSVLMSTASPSIASNPQSESPGDLASLYRDATPPVSVPMARGLARSARNARAGSQCSGYLWTPDKKDARQAEAIMSGWFKLDRYGYMRLPANPNWRNQSTLNSSGNGAQHSLYWALPLLRTGLSNGRPDMVARFFGIVDDWLRDNPVRRPRSSQAYGQIESGFRLITLACAAQYGGPRSGRYVKAMKVQAKYLVRRWQLVNNASFHQASGIFAAGCVAGNRRLRSRALSYLNRAASALIQPDGSVLEGSLEYARATYIWTLDQNNRLRGCGVNPPEGLARAERIPAFLAFGIRPDGKYEAIGDGAAKEAIAADAPGVGTFEYAATGGAQGHSPGSLYARFGAGFIFGRSSWAGGDEFSDATFYSLRTGSGPSSVYHAHADAGALTLQSLGSQLLFDAGPYYGYSALRERASHNLALIEGVGYRSPAPEVQVARSDASGDITTLLDRAYARTGIVRTVWYDRIGEFFVVIDDVQQRKPSRKRGSVAQNWNFGPDRTVRLEGSSAHTEGTGANVSVISVGGAPGYSILRGSRSPWGGWNSEQYSEVTPAPSLRVAGGRARSERLATVIIPRGVDEDASAVGATGSIEEGGALVTVTRGDKSYQLRIRRGGGERL